MTPMLAAASTTAHHTAHHPGGWILLAVLATAVYIVHCVIWPYRACRKCRGIGRFGSPSGRSWRYCTRCAGRGAQLRPGRRAWTHLKDLDHRDRNHR